MIEKQGVFVHLRHIQSIFYRIIILIMSLFHGFFIITIQFTCIHFVIFGSKIAIGYNDNGVFQCKFFFHFIDLSSLAWWSSTTIYILIKFVLLTKKNFSFFHSLSIFFPLRLTGKFFSFRKFTQFFPIKLIF